MRCGDWNAHNRALMEQTQRIGAPYYQKFLEAKANHMKGKPSNKSQQSHGENTSWRKRTIDVGWCDVCDSEISGNGSVVQPYECACSSYQFDYVERAYSARVSKKKNAQ